ncbi:ABC transporter [Thermoclostridium stercorarium subsp. thermolacticum DSM 2910]|jgi:iron complex transport system ATP-binding protein|uniref:ABC transporter n=2 Tax=Thermoclostridium stercorarium TaxID=1510 RepID=A0A1B1YMT3_THEST|nr:heme ABC transporter ATP-binding protein [Thermoclostridium stercorarium]AGI40158.1 ABC transporter ATPase subunit [Thermoclostridium stercorarium subsp. stercorarium DSM 8532]ANW99465.1 ABC transporter [Thermoclostridium stercorarium subsp. thermolacticum DSM 2910]ANX02091.1 ABC transporter [Thermoclostridium stercorarium subsp. leptospartum DSM 9219]UZQ85154.1 heme ABC transporter ATP-binding protein [Thermoclostridium stercorarium]
MERSVSVENLNFSYGDRKVLENICARFKPGTVNGLLGPNGSGKTTLLKNIASILKPEKNAVYINFKDIAKMTSAEIAKELALVPQSTHIEFDFTVEDIVMMGRTPHIKGFSNETEEDREIVRWALETTGVSHLKDRSIRSISGGELQRVIIARALAQKTPIILLDEPVSQLDIHHQLSIMETITRLAHEQGLTVVTVLHDLNLAAEYCDTVYLLKGGRIVCGGTPKEVLTYQVIEEVYDIVCLVYENPVSKKPHIIPVSSR